MKLDIASNRPARVFGSSIANIAQARPADAKAAIKHDFPNEDGVPNHQPHPTQAAVDNRDMLTGTDETGSFTTPLRRVSLGRAPWATRESKASLGSVTLGRVAQAAEASLPGASSRSFVCGMPVPGGGLGFGGDSAFPGGDAVSEWDPAATSATPIIGCRLSRSRAAKLEPMVETGGPSNTEVTVGSGGGYGGSYCFVLEP